MKWWVKALLVSILWVLLVCGIGYIHTEVFLRGSITEAEDLLISKRYGQLAGIGIVFILFLADCMCRWNSRREEFSEEKLLQQARNAKRNVAGLAVLMTLYSIITTYAMTLAPRGADAGIINMQVTYIILSTGLWILYAAVRRGEPRAVGTIIVCQLVVLAAVVLGYGAMAVLASPASTSTADLSPALLLGIVIHLGIYIGLMKNRLALIELRTRGLSDRVFPGAKSGKRLCTAGGVLLALGCVILVTGVPAAGYLEGRSVAEDMRVARTFIEIMEEDEQALMTSFKAIGGPDPASAYENSMAHIGQVEQKVATALEEAGDDDEMRLILATYGNALKMWRAGLEEFMSKPEDRSEAFRLFEEGDRLRVEASGKFRALCRERAKA
jgi:hypothetical protein